MGIFRLVGIKTFSFLSWKIEYLPSVETVPFSDSHVCVGWRCKNRRCFIFLTLRKMEVDVFLYEAFLHLLKLHFHLKATNYSNYILLRPKESRTKGIQKKHLSHTHSSNSIQGNSFDHMSSCVCSSTRVLTNNNEANASTAEEKIECDTRRWHGREYLLFINPMSDKQFSSKYCTAKVVRSVLPIFLFFKLR